MFVAILYINLYKNSISILQKMKINMLSYYLLLFLSMPILSVTDARLKALITEHAKVVKLRLHAYEEFLAANMNVRELKKTYMTTVSLLKDSTRNKKDNPEIWSLITDETKQRADLDNVKILKDQAFDRWFAKRIMTSRLEYEIKQYIMDNCYHSYEMSEAKKAAAEIFASDLKIDIDNYHYDRPND
jgi:hypothetical protein